MEPDIKHQRAYDQDRCHDFIKNALDDMGRSGFDFSYSSQAPFQGKPKEMKRNGVYLRFNCTRCSQGNRGNRGSKGKRFTSTMGTIIIQFQLRKLDVQRRYPWLIVFKFRIYRMKCLGCNRYGQGEIYDSQLEKIENQFCEIIGNILSNAPRKPKTRIKNAIKVPILPDHKHEECEACSLGKCHDGSCP